MRSWKQVLILHFRSFQHKMKQEEGKRLTRSRDLTLCLSRDFILQFGGIFIEVKHNWELILLQLIYWVFSLCSIEEHNKCDFLAIFLRPDLTRFNLWLLPEKNKGNESLVLHVISIGFSNSNNQNDIKSGLFPVTQIFHKHDKTLA